MKHLINFPACPLLLLSFIFAICAFSATCQQSTTQKKPFYRYKVGKIPNITDFQALNPQEESYAKSMPEDNELSGNGAFKTNRSRIFFDKVIKNEETEKLDSSALKAISVPCSCYINGDTIKLNTGIGMMGGFGFNLQFHKKHFQPEFYLYTDDIKPYKSNLTDTEFQNYALVGMKKAVLTLEAKPGFVVSEQLIGFLSFTTHNFYEQNINDRLDSRNIVGRLYFTCNVRKKLLWER